MLGITSAINRLITTLASPALPSGAATQTTLAAVLQALLPPGSHTALTPSDSTDITAVASIGFLCTADGTIAYRGVTTSGTTVSHTIVAGQYIYGRFSRLMAATTATVVGLAP